MVNIDSLTDTEIDRIFGRIEKSIDIEKVKSIEDLFGLVAKDKNTKGFSDKFGQAVFGRKFENKRYGFGKVFSRFERVSKLGKKYFQVVARSRSTGRFVKVNEEAKGWNYG